MSLYTASQLVGVAVMWLSIEMAGLLGRAMSYAAGGAIVLTVLVGVDCLLCEVCLCVHEDKCSLGQAKMSASSSARSSSAGGTNP